MKLANIDARIKLLLLAVLSSCAMLLKSPVTLAGLLLLQLLALLLGGITPGRLWRQTRLIFSLIGLLFLLQCLFIRTGLPLLTWGNVVLLTRNGLQAGLLVALRLLIVVDSALLVLTGEVRDYLLALRWLGLPWEICYMVLAALRFIPLLREEAQSVWAAMLMRGCDIRSASLPQKAQLYVSMLAPITAGALQRAEAMSISMEARAFRSLPDRSSWRKLHMQKKDLAYAAVLMLLLFLIIFVCP